MITIIIAVTLFFLSCSISTSFTVMLYFILKKDLHRKSSRLMFSMALADLIGATFWFADILKTICPLTMVVNLYGYQSAQAWSCIIGVYLVLKFSGKKMPPEYVFHLIAWGLPFIPQAVILAKKLYKEHPPPQGCWIEFGMMEMVVVSVPQIISVFLNTAFLVFICARRKSKVNRWGFKNSDRSLLLIQICCLITTLAGALQSIPNAPEMVYNASYVLGAAQGLLNTLSMRQRMVVRFFSVIFKGSHQPSSLIQVDDATIRDFSRHSIVTTSTNYDLDKSHRRSQEIQSISNLEEVEEGEKEDVMEASSYDRQGVAPSSVLVFKPFGTYQALKSSDIN